MSRNQNVIIIGANGYVGQAMVKFFEPMYNVLEKDKHSVWGTGKTAAVLAVVCVPTPMAPDGSCDTSIVEEVIQKVDCPIWLRSTVAPGTTEWLSAKYGKRIVFSPEYIGESSYWTSYKFGQKEIEMPFWIFGGESDDCQHIIDLIAPMAGPQKAYRVMEAVEAELVKYKENTYFALKVAFANEWRKICEAFGANYWTVRDGWALDPRVDPMHTAVFPDAPGFGGKCLPKDLNAIIEAAAAEGYDARLLKEVWESNKRFRGEE